MFVFKRLLPGTPAKKKKKKKTVKKNRDVDDFWKGNIRHLIYRKYSEGKILVFQ
jgi:hypothetical protein